MKLERIFFLHHSGFLIELSNCLLVFDYYQDPENVLDHVLSQSDKPLYFFVSHVHADHFNKTISRYKKRASGYFLHEDCRQAAGYFGGSEQYMVAGKEIQSLQFRIRMTGSTDTGGSFWIMHPELTLFHAGDLNWWHWPGEPEEDNTNARAMYFEELGHLKGMQADVAFFPVDARQEAAREWGVKCFLETVAVKELLVPMHAFGSRWCPSYEFRWRFPGIPLWIPQKEGDVYTGVPI